MNKQPPNFLDGLVEAIELFRRRIEALASSILTGILRFLDEVGRWLLDICDRISKYLLNLGRALGRLFMALLKLIAFYLPGILCVVGAIRKSDSPTSTFFLILGLAWIGLVTLIGLAYKHRSK